MYLDASILFLSAFLSGISFQLFPFMRKRNFDFILVFAGSYLLSITIIHILPEVYLLNSGSFQIALMVLAGFMLQMFLEALSSGIEHGHYHLPEKSLHFSFITPVILMTGLSVHSFLEGTIVAPPLKSAIHNHTNDILLGIVLHKIPAAIALMSVLTQISAKKTISFIYLLIFSLASPAGLIVSRLLSDFQILSSQAMSLLYALVSGSFLHIATTIFFESNPQHSMRGTRLILILLGVMMAIGVELVL